MSKKVGPSAKGTKKDTPEPKGKARQSTKPSRKPKKRQQQSKLAAALNGRLGVALVGTLFIFGALMLVAMLPLRLALFPNGFSLAQAEEYVPTLIAAPLIQVDVTLIPPSEPEEEESEPEPESDGGASEQGPKPGAMPTPDGIYREVRVPILMYHYVSTPPEDADIYRLDLSVTPEQFDDHLDWLDANGYTTIALYDLVNHLATGEQLPDKPVILTFDDGYRDNYENAFPVLQEHDAIGNFFILTGVTEAGHPDYVTWAMVQEMFEAGQQIEMHAHDHLNLDNRDDGYLLLQVGISAEIVEERLGYRPRFLAYPGGDYDENTIEALKDAGYWLGLTTNFGCLHTTENAYELQRIRVRGEYSAAVLGDLISQAFEDDEFCYGLG